MAALLTNFIGEEYRSRDNLIEYTGIITVGAGEVASPNSIAITLPMTTRGLLSNFAILCASLDYNISLRKADSITPPSLSEIYAVSNINKVLDSHLTIYYSNKDTIQTNNLYLVIKNNDGVNPTGNISLRLFVNKL